MVCEIHKVARGQLSSLVSEDDGGYSDCPSLRGKTCLDGGHQANQITQIKIEQPPQVRPSLHEAPVKGKSLIIPMPEIAMSKLTLPAPFLYLPLASHLFSRIAFPNLRFCVSNL